MVVGILGLLAAVLLPLAPVLHRSTTVTWPQAENPPKSTTAFFVPYAPSAANIRIPCSVVRAGVGTGSPTTLVSSDRPGKASKGFTVSTAEGDLIALVGGRQIYRGPVPAGDCTTRLTASASGSAVQVGGSTVANSTNRVLRVVAFATDLPPDQANGLSVTARTADWFANAPTGAKLVLTVLQLALAAASLGMLWWADRHRRGTLRRRARSGGGTPWWRVRPRWLIDAGLVVVLGVWTVLGPRTPDDSFTEGIVRNGLNTGAFTNYYRWQNAAEAPFTLVLHLVQPLVAAGASPLVLRLPSVLAALLSWLLLSRTALGVLLPEHAKRWWVRGLLAVGFLAWWMPFNLGIRPEPFVVLGTVAVFALLLRATTRPGNDGLLLVGLAALAAGLTVAVNPVGIVAAAPIVVLAPGLWRTLRGTDGSHRRGLASLMPVLCLGAVGLVAMFADQSLYGVVRATQLHDFYGPAVPWFEEFKRYQRLLGFDEQGGFGRRLPVLVTLAVLPGVTALLARGAARLPGLRWAFAPLATLAVALGLLWLTPSKWSHYFGAVAGFGGAALTTAVVVLVCAARQRRPGRTVLFTGGVSALLVAGAAGLAFAGKNTWFLYSRFGVPDDETPVWPFNSPLLWLLLAAVLLAVAATPRFGRSARAMLVRLPGVLAATAVVLGVMVMLISFVMAPIRQADSYSVGRQNVRSLLGHTCGLGDQVVTTQDTARGVLTPVRGQPQLTGFTANGGYDSQHPPPDTPGTGVAAHMWGSRNSGDLSTGRMTSPWFRLPALRQHQELALSVAGRTGDGNHLSVQFARSGPTPRVLGERVLDDAYTENDKQPQYPTERVKQPKPQDHPSWRALHLDRSAIPPGADLVRIRAVDATTDPGGWLAVTGPRVRDVAPLRDFLSSAPGPTYVDWSMNWSVPCAGDRPAVGRGIVQAPRTMLIPPASLGFDGQAPFSASVGGAFMAVDEVGTRSTVPTRLLGSRDTPNYMDWGSLVRVSYPIQRDAYDVTTVRHRRWGWQGEFAPVSSTPPVK